MKLHHPVIVIAFAALLSSATAAEKTTAPSQPAVVSAVEQAHSELWRRFIDRHNVMLDFTMLDGSVSLPTPEECHLGKPNALGWWTPIENGAMFGGLYMDAAVNRWRHTKSADDAAKARRLMEGLLFLSSISDVKGFVGRGVSTDGKSHYAMGSNDQTLPWLLGLWRYLDSGLATPDERKRIVAKLTETAEVILQLNWAMPAEPPFGKRGAFSSSAFGGMSRLLFTAKLMHTLTGDAKWDKIYREALAQRGGKDRAPALRCANEACSLRRRFTTLGPTAAAWVRCAPCGKWRRTKPCARPSPAACKRVPMSPSNICRWHNSSSSMTSHSSIPTGANA